MNIATSRPQQKVGQLDYSFNFNCFVSALKHTVRKGEPQRFYKLVSYESAVKILKNDICITEIGQAVLEIFKFKVEFPRKIPKIRNFASVSVIRVEQ